MKRVYGERSDNMKQYYLVYNATTTSTIDCWCGDNSKAEVFVETMKGDYDEHRP